MTSIVRTTHLLSGSGPILCGHLLMSCARPPRAQSVTALDQARAAKVKPELGKEYPKAVYERASTLRHSANNMPRREPNGFEDFTGAAAELERLYSRS